MEVVLLEYISDCLGIDRVGDNIVDEMGSLNSIIKLFYYTQALGVVEVRSLSVKDIV